MNSSKKADYGNWVPRKLMNALWGLFLGLLLLAVLNALFWRNSAAALLLGAFSALSLAAAAYMQYCRRTVDLRGGGLSGKFYDELLDHLAWQGQGRLLDIGCGWGGLAKYMAARRGCRVTAVNISKEQLAFAKEDCRGLPVKFLDCDYRDIDGEYDKIVSVGMFEHVGSKNFRTYMKVVHRLLRENGLFLLHTIGGNRSGVNCDRWLNRYIFPNGALPSAAQIAAAAEGLFVIEDLHNFGSHYDKTLMSWYRNFTKAWPAFAERYGERFQRMWSYYLLSCAGAFRSRAIQLFQVVMTREGDAREQPLVTLR